MLISSNLKAQRRGVLLLFFSFFFLKSHSSYKQRTWFMYKPIHESVCSIPLPTPLQFVLFQLREIEKEMSPCLSILFKKIKQRFEFAILLLSLDQSIFLYNLQFNNVFYFSSREKH